MMRAIPVLWLGLALGPPSLFAQSLQKTRSMAETQHEIAVLLIQKKEYPRAVAEAAKIFQLTWPEDQESMLLKELRFFADQFLHGAQPAYGIQLIEAVQGRFREVKSRVAISKEKGYLYKELKQQDKALECFREAQRLERNGAPD
jgi:tetratricopeptide (TPR) repeat protein